MKVWIHNIDAWNIVFYNEVSLLNKLSDLNIEIYQFKQLSKYKFYFETYRKNRKVIADNFRNCKLISRSGMLNYLEMMVKKTTLFSVIIASFFLYNVSRRILKIDIVGDYESVEEIINNQLIAHNIAINKYYPDLQKLSQIESDISLYLAKEIEFLEIRRKGSVINVRYQKRRVSDELPLKGVNLYATKDGMIRRFDIQSGVKMVKEYDYVRKGDLLVSEVVETNGGELIDVGTLGSVYANTFYVIEVSVDYDFEDESVVFSRMLDKAKRKVSENISKNEYIEKESVLNYLIKDKKGYMKVYYMLLEDITI